MNGTLSPTVDKICRIIGYTIGAAIVAIPLIALISSDLTLGEIVSWCMNSFGWLLIAAVAIPLVLAVLVAVFVWLLPYFWVGFGLLGIAVGQRFYHWRHPVPGCGRRHRHLALLKRKSAFWEVK